MLMMIIIKSKYEQIPWSIMVNWQPCI